MKIVCFLTNLWKFWIESSFAFGVVLRMSPVLNSAMTTIQVQPLTRKFPIVTLFVSGNPPVRRCLSTTLVHCQGPGRALHCQGVDNETPPAIPLNNSRPLPRTWGSCPLPRISLCSSVPRIERACYSRACWRPGEWGCTPTPHAGELSIPA